MVLIPLPFGTHHVEKNVGVQGTHRVDFKMEYLSALEQRMREQVELGKNVCLVGDINIAHKEQDIFDPKVHFTSPRVLCRSFPVPPLPLSLPCEHKVMKWCCNLGAEERGACCVCSDLRTVQDFCPRSGVGWTIWLETPPCPMRTQGEMRLENLCIYPMPLSFHAEEWRGRGVACSARGRVGLLIRFGTSSPVHQGCTRTGM